MSARSLRLATILFSNFGFRFPAPVFPSKLLLMFQPTLFKNSAIFISGGGTGLGRSMALKFAELGAQIFIIGRREQPLKDTCEEIRRAGGSAEIGRASCRERVWR